MLINSICRGNNNEEKIQIIEERGTYSVMKMRKVGGRTMFGTV